MQRINTAYFYRLATKLMPLRSIEAEKIIFDFYSELHNAEEELRAFLGNPLMPPMTCGGSGYQLLLLLEEFVAGSFPAQNPDNPNQEPVWPKFQWNDPGKLKEALTQFEITLQSDFAVRDTFIVSPKGAYSTTLLAEKGEALVSEAAHALVDSMRKDLHEAGRCMAFELPTSAAFHLFRAVEAMVCSYGEYVRKKKFSQPEKKRGLGGYANLLKEESLKVDKRITNAIEQLSQLHRNPTMHPEMQISNTEIHATVGMAVSVIETIAIDWIRRRDTPSTALTDLLPDDSAVMELTDGSE